MKWIGTTLDGLVVAAGIGLLAASVLRAYHAVCESSIPSTNVAQTGYKEPETPEIQKARDREALLCSGSPIDVIDAKVEPPKEQPKKEEKKIQMPQQENKENYPDPYTTDRNFSNDDERMLLARMIFAEKAIDNDIARIAAAYTARNRLADGRYGTTLREVIMADGQYSCLKKKREEMMDPYRKADGSVNEYNKRRWDKCYEIAGKVLANSIADPTNGVSYADLKKGPGDESTWLLTDGNKQKNWMKDPEFTRVVRIQSGPGREMWVYTRKK